MCALDPRERPRNSQSVNKYILSVQDIYRNSPVPVCVRNQNRKILYANGAFIELFSKEISPFRGKAIFVIRLRFIYPFWSWSVSLLGMVQLFVVALIFMAKSIR